jgi:hypothetical protein
MNYDSKIIQQFADRLYAKARSVVVNYTILGTIIGLFAGITIAQIPSYSSAMGAVVAIAVSFFGMCGFIIGRERAFKFKLEAQVALCQVQFEENTRKNNS